MSSSADLKIDQAITRNLPQLSKYGVLTARPGYEIAGHQLTGRRAIVATVHTKKPLTQLKKGEALPDVIGGIPVDVREASPYQRLLASDPLAADVSQTYRRPEDAEPEWPLERELPGGELLRSATSATQKKLKAQMKAQPLSAQALTVHQHKPQLPYKPVGCPALQTLEVKGRVTAAVSPDCGLTTLSEYLSGTKASLCIGMYDFTSAQILGDFKNDLAAPKELQMVLDDPAPNPTRDQTDWQTVQDLNGALAGRASIAWALTRSDPFVSHWLFPYAYHIKVIVRDKAAVWISSGNLNRSNEPDLQDPPSTQDRDWHLIIEDPGLAGIFAAYLNFDYQQASGKQLQNQPAIEKAIEDARAKRAREANPIPPAHPHSPARALAGSAPKAAAVFEDLSFTVTPLLTPDKLSDGTGQYVTNIVNLIKAARSSIYIQLQYIEASKGNGSIYDALLQAIADQVAANTDVKLIVSANYAEKWGEKMKDAGVDLTASIHTLPNVHNKGFVIDGKTVVVSSQNFSPAGISDNRDAGVLLESAEIAAYFGLIFEDDWNNSLPLVVKGQTHQAARTKPEKVAAKKTKMSVKVAPRKAPKKAKRARRRT